MANSLSRQMQKPGPKSGKAIRGGLLLAFGVWLAIPAFAWSASPTTSSPAAWPKHNFLPPVAVINPKLEARRGTSGKASSHTNDNAVEAVSLTAVSSPVLHGAPKVTRLDAPVAGGVKDNATLGLAEIRQKVEEADLEHLWQATVEKNPVIRFSLEKLATPADLHTRQSSRFLSRTLSTMISGATMAATMMPGGGAYRNMTSVAAGNALQNLVNGRTPVTPGSLSPTEQIQMAGLIDELKLKLIHTYQDYHASLESLAQSRETTARNSALYSQALATKNDMAIMAAAQAYYQAMDKETLLRQKACLQRLELERMAGKEALARLEFTPRLSDGQTVTASGSSGAPASPVATPSSLPPEPAASGEPAVGPAVPEIGPAAPPSTASKTATVKGRTVSSKKSVAALSPRKAKASPRKPVALPLEIPPQAMLEIGPSPAPEIGPALPLPLPTAANGAAKSGKKTSSAPDRHYAQARQDAMPLPIPDKILDTKEGLPYENAH
jgi:hypothetical protein